MSSSVPPPMVPSARERIDMVYEQWTGDHGCPDIEVLHEEAMRQAYRDGWNAALAASQASRHLFVDGAFTAHSGSTLPYKIECDALTDADLATLAADIANRVKFSRVIGVPRGGIRLQAALRPYLEPGHGTLIVDDVLTTGASMEEYRQRFDPAAQGVVIFARGPCPAWVTPLFGDVVAFKADIRLLEKAHGQNNRALSNALNELAASQAEVARLQAKLGG